jgi:Ca2+-binding RTX toxin-like protein
VVGAGRQVVIGRGGDDCIQTGPDADLAIAGGGDDEVFLGTGNDMAVGGTGDDRLNGEGGADRLIGNQGDDILEGGADSGDLCIGGHGTDVSYPNGIAGPTKDRGGAKRPASCLVSPLSQGAEY